MSEETCLLKVASCRLVNSFIFCSPCILLLIIGIWSNWHTIIFYVFILILYMFRATSCPSSGESIVSIQPLVYVTLCRWPFRVQVRKEFLSDLHKERSPTQSGIYQRLYWYNWFSWWWARGCSKHNNNNNNVYWLQMGRHPVAVVI